MATWEKKDARPDAAVPRLLRDGPSIVARTAADDWLLRTCIGIDVAALPPSAAALSLLSSSAGASMAALCSKGKSFAPSLSHLSTMRSTLPIVSRSSTLVLESTLVISIKKSL